MNLKCMIHGKEFPIVQGVTFSEEYNETLDSGSLIITHVSKIRKLRPYNDVFIFDNEFNGFGENLNPRDHNKFYKHMLVQNFTEEILNLKDKIYKYKISLMSEIKALEKVQLPNISVTQPLKARYKVSVYEYLVRFVKMYSPKYKKAISDTKKWEYVQKYTVDPKLEEIFGNVYSPDFTLNLPTLRDLISKLMIVKDMIPYVEDNVIKAMDITERKKPFELDEKHMNYITGSMHNEDYCTGLRRNYSDALSQDSTCRSIEYIGFRNSDSSLVTLGNMQLETRFPIYKINKLYMCYYKEANLYNYADNKSYQFLCKQDITPLVKLNTERNALSKDWEDFEEFIPSSIEDLANYKLATLGYEIGTKKISGWGENYSFPKGWWRQDKKTFLENILLVIDNLYETGVYNYDKLFLGLSEAEIENIKTLDSGDIFNRIITPFSGDVNIADIIKIEVKSIVDIKGLFFIVDYQGFYNGAVITAKDNIENDDIISNDNSSSSLTLLELDGLSQKEKANRFGNKTIQISARYESFDQLQNLGDVYNNEDDTDVIIYHREYSIYDNQINCIYFGVKDYVLKNYYTSVFARHRTWNLIPYSESVRRSENKKVYLYLSKNELFYENEIELNFSKHFYDNNLLISCFAKNDFPKAIDDYGNDNKINYGYLKTNAETYLTDVNCFTNGYSLCFNLSMFDNISTGSYIKKVSPFVNKTYDGDLWENKNRNWLITNDDYTGSSTELYKIVDDNTGTIKNMGFYLCHHDMSEKFNESLEEYNKQKVLDVYYNELLLLPKAKITLDNTYTNIIGKDFEIYKDNKETIDMTYQIEPICLDNDILFSSWFMKLNDLLSNYYKLEQDYTYKYQINEKIYNTNDSFELTFDLGTITRQKTMNEAGTLTQTYELPRIVISMSNEEYQKFKIAYKKSLQTGKPIKIEYGESVNSNPAWSFITSKDITLPADTWKKQNVISGIQLSPLEIRGFNEATGELNVYCYQNTYMSFKGETYVSNYEGFINLIFNKSSIYSKDKNNVYFDFQFSSTNMLIPGYIFSNGQSIQTIIHTVNAEGVDDYVSISNGYFVNPNKLEELLQYYNERRMLYWNDNELTKKYYQNMYLVLSKKTLKNTLVYDEYTEENIPYIIIPKNVSEVFEVTNRHINVNLKNLRNNGYKFNDTITTTKVINPPSSDTDDSYESIYLYCSFTSQDGVVYDRIELDYDTYSGLQMYYREAKSNANISVYNQDTGWVDEKYRLLKEDIVYNTTNDLNNFSKNEFDEWKTKNLEKQILDLTNINSIQYWYKDIQEEIGTKISFNEYVEADGFNFYEPVTIYVDFKDQFGNSYNKIILNDNGIVFTVKYGKLGSSTPKAVYSSEYGWESKEYQNISEVEFQSQTKGNISEELFNQWISANAEVTNDINLMKFVFGVNLSEEDKQKDSIKIYTSLISNRNPNVYDENYNIVGKVHNYVKNDINKPYGTAQYYDEEDID